MEYNLERFIKAQNRDYPIALSEIRDGYKRSHWIWYIFPQLKQLGRSSLAQYYGIDSIDEAKAYLLHPVLRARLEEICEALLKLDSGDPYRIMGNIDGMKLRSSMTLFSEAAGRNSIFDRVLLKYYDGKKDDLTIKLLNIK